MKFTILLCFALLLTIGVQAQSLTLKDDALDKMVTSVSLSGHQMATFEMKQELKLTQEQTLAVEQLNKQRYELMSAAQVAHAQEPELLTKTFRTIASSTDFELAKVLDEKQLENYLEIEGRKTSNFISTAVE